MGICGEEEKLKIRMHEEGCGELACCIAQMG